MGTRTLFQIISGEQEVVATLFANCSHSTECAEAVFMDAAKSAACRFGPSAIVEFLLTQRYKTQDGNHKSGDRMFWMEGASSEADGDFDTLIKAKHCGFAEQLLTSGYIQLQGQAWECEQITWNSVV